jgi:hypothetical protein
MRGERSRPARGKYICMRDLPAAGRDLRRRDFYFWGERGSRKAFEPDRSCGPGAAVLSLYMGWADVGGPGDLESKSRVLGNERGYRVAANERSQGILDVVMRGFCRLSWLGLRG